MNQQSRILITGARGLVGSALVREFSRRGFKFLVTPSREELDLTEQAYVRFFFQNNEINYVFHCAATVGGIHTNSTRHADFLYQNLMMEANVIHAAHERGVKKLLFLGSSCIYPRLAGELTPITEDRLLSGPLEPTNEGYAIGKIAGIKLCQFYRKEYGDDFISAMVTNVYGPRDNFDLSRSHIIPALMRRFHESRRRADTDVKVWGTGKPIREFIHSDDLARALILLMESPTTQDMTNVGTGSGITVADLAIRMKEVTHFDGEIRFDPSKPDGTPRKILDVSRIRDLGFKPQIELMDGLKHTYRWAQDHNAI